MSRIEVEKQKLLQKTRRPYRKPHLHSYGAVKDLTAGGSGNKAEGHQPKKGYPKKPPRP